MGNSSSKPAAAPAVDYYAVLELTPTVTKEQINIAFHRLVQLHHHHHFELKKKNNVAEGPAEKHDQDNTAVTSAKQYQRIQKLLSESYEILSDDTKRHVYDLTYSPYSKAQQEEKQRLTITQEDEIRVKMANHEAQILHEAWRKKEVQKIVHQQEHKATVGTTATGDYAKNFGLWTVKGAAPVDTVAMKGFREEYEKNSKEAAKEKKEFEEKMREKVEKGMREGEDRSFLEFIWS